MSTGFYLILVPNDPFIIFPAKVKIIILSSLMLKVFVRKYGL